MKNKIFMYLFIFASLIVVFQYVNSKKILDAGEKRMGLFIAKNEALKDSLANQKEELSDLSLFPL